MGVVSEANCKADHVFAGSGFIKGIGRTRTVGERSSITLSGFATDEAINLFLWKRDRPVDVVGVASTGFGDGRDEHPIGDQ